MKPEVSERKDRLRSVTKEQSTNLAEPLTTFVGRHAEMTALKKLLKEFRMITLTGTGGIGKSRLAIQLGTTMSGFWSDGVWWVDLTPVDDPRQVAGTIASALHLQGAGTALEKVTSWLADKNVLIVLDNCEHLVTASADFCRTALERCGGLRVLATSREALGIHGEVRWRVSPLNQADSLALFEQRGRLALPTFKITAANRGDVSEICRRLDDLPLAIELAASRLGIMTERQISVELADRFRLLSVARTTNARHKTMAATIDWSYHLLTPSEATLFRRLAVFRGGFSLEAARAICRDERVPDLLESLAGLVEKSMVVVERLDDGETRYRLLESQAVYADEKLRATDELRAVQKHHYEFFVDAMEDRTGGLTGPMTNTVEGIGEATWKRREYANCWAAFRWARENSEDLGLELAAMLAYVDTVEGGQVLTPLRELLDRLPDDRRIPSRRHEQRDARPPAAIAACTLAFTQGDYESALELARQAVDLLPPDPAHPWKEERAEALRWSGAALDALGRREAAQTALEEAMNLVEGSDNVRLMAALQNTLGCIALKLGHFERARDVLSRCAQISVTTVDPFMSAAYLESLASAELACGDMDSAERSWRSAIAMSRPLVNRWKLITCLGGLSRLATARGDHARAIRLAAAHSRACEDWFMRESPFWQAELARSQQASREKLGSKKSNEAWQQGQAMDLDDALDYALGSTPGAERSPRSGPLSRREVDVVRLITAGMTNREIAQRLFVSERTAEGHVERIRNKLGLRSRTEVAVWATQHALADEDTETEENPVYVTPERHRLCAVALKRVCCGHE